MGEEKLLHRMWWDWCERWFKSLVVVAFLRPLKLFLARVYELVGNEGDAGGAAAAGENDELVQEQVQRVQVGRTRSKGLDDIPGPRPSLPFIGTSWTYWFGAHDLKKLHEANFEKLLKYGRIMKEEFRFGCPLVQIFDAVDIEKVVKHHVRCPMRPANEAMSKYRRQHPEHYHSTGLVNAQGEEWYSLRAQLSPILTRQKTLLQYLPAQNEIVDDYVQMIRMLRDDNNDLMDTTGTLYRLALESVAVLCLDTRLRCLETDLHPNSEAQRMIEATYRMFEAYQELYYGLPLWKYIETPAYKKLSHSEETTYSIASKYVDRAMEQAEELRASGCLDAQESGLAILMSLISETNLNVQDIRTTMVDFMVAGIDTVSNTVLYILYHLAKNPTVQERLHQEIERVIPDRGAITGPNLANMLYLKACIKESFRLTPSIPNIIRILPDDITIQDYLIPAGTPICCHTMVASRMSEYFEQPDAFIPERWLGPGASSLRMTVLPFGYGPRMCIGRRFAEQEVSVAVAKIIQNFEIECLADSLDCIYRFMVIPEKSLAFKFTDR